MKKFWKWTNQAQTETAPAERTLYLNGTIAEESWFDDDVTPQLFKEELMAGDGNITVWINSPGGDCVAAAQIYNMLMDYPHEVTVKIDGIAASAASVIAMAGTRVLMSPVSMLMLSNSLNSTSGSLAATPYAVKMAYDRNSWTSISLTNALAIAYGGTGAKTAAAARTNLGISATSLYNGTLTSGSITFNHGNYNFYVFIGRPNSSASRASLVVPKIMLTTSAVSFQIADESNYKSFNLSYSGSLVTLSMGNGNGQINRVFGVN